MSLFLYCRYFCPQRQFFFPVNKCEGYWRAQKPVLSTRLVISLSLVAGPKSSDNRKSSFTPFCRLFCRLSFFFVYIFFFNRYMEAKKKSTPPASQPASQPAHGTIFPPDCHSAPLTACFWIAIYFWLYNHKNPDSSISA